VVVLTKRNNHLTDMSGKMGVLRHSSSNLIHEEEDDDNIGNDLDECHMSIFAFDHLRLTHEVNDKLDNFT